MKIHGKGENDGMERDGCGALNEFYTWKWWKIPEILCWVFAGVHRVCEWSV